MEILSKRTSKPNPRYIYSSKDVQETKHIAEKCGKEKIPGVTVKTSLSSSKSATFKKRRQLKSVQSKKVQGPKTNGSNAQEAKHIAERSGMEPTPNLTIKTSLSTSLVGSALKNGRQVKSAQSEEVKGPKPNGPNAEKRSLCMNTKKKKDKRNKVVKYHFTIDSSAIDEVDLHGLGEFIKSKMKVFRQTKIKNRKLVVTSETVFKKSSLKYWTKKYMKENVERSVDVLVTSKRSCNLHYSPLE